jgi:hypothetical protein
MFVFVGVVKVLGCLEEAGPIRDVSSPFDWFVVCTITYHVVCHSFCVLVSGGPVTFASRSGLGI